MGLGHGVVKTMRKVFVISHTRLHEAHRHCTICQAGPFSTVEEIYDHLDAHLERLNGSCIQKDGRWIVLYEPSDFYREHQSELPESLAHLPSIDEQARVLGIDDYDHHNLELTDLRSLRKAN